DLSDIRDRLAFFIQRRLRKAQQPDSGLGGPRRIASAQQSRTQAMFEIRDSLAAGRLRKIQPLCSAAETAGLDDRVKAAQLIAFNLHMRRITDRACYPLHG